MKKKGRFLTIIILLAPVVLFLTGCAAPKLYSINMNYDAAQAAAPAQAASRDSWASLNSAFT